MAKVKTDELKAKLRAGKELAPLDFSEGLSSGSTLQNLAMTGKAAVGFLPGKFYLWAGKSGSGKSFLNLTTLAEACINPRFANYKIKFANVEDGALMDFRKYFGKLADRLEPLSGDWRAPPRTLEEFYYNVYAVLDDGPCVILLDSMDPLVPEAEFKKFDADRKKRAKGEDAGGSYGTAKAKINSSHLRVVFGKLQDTNSLLIVISQSRDNIGFGATFQPETRSGGRALTFYACQELWTGVKGHIKRSVRGRSMEVGVVCSVRVKKNRVYGSDRTVQVPILHKHGIDDVGGNVDYLIEWNHWEVTKGKTGKVSSVIAPEFDYDGKPEGLIQTIEEANRERDLRNIVADVWRQVEEESTPDRKPRYAT